MAIKFNCTHCSHGLTVKDELAGKKGRCPRCKNVITVPAPVSAPADAEQLAAKLLGDQPAAAAAEEEPKFVNFNCPQCDEPVQLPAELAGKRAPCPHCR